MTFQDGFKFQDFPGFSMTVGTLPTLLKQSLLAYNSHSHPTQTVTPTLLKQ